MAALNDSSQMSVDSHTGIKTHALLCVLDERNLHHRGIWYGDSPFDFVYPTVLAKIIVVSLISRLLYWLLRPIKQPKFVCQVLSGIIIGPSFMARNPEIKKRLFPPRESETLLTLAIIGGIYSLFLVGVKMDSALILRSARNAWRIGLFGFFTALTVTTSLIFSLIPHFPGIHVGGAFIFYVALSLSYTFFPVLAQALEELNLLNSELGHLAMSSAMLNDFIYWFFMAISVAFKQESMSNAFQAVCAFLTFLLFTFTVIRRAVYSIIRRTPVGKPINELYIVGALVCVLLMAAVSDFIGATWILGSLIFGLIIPGGPPLGSALVQKTESIVSEFLMPLFFVQVGYCTNLKMISNWEDFKKLQVVIVLGYLSKLLGTFVVSLSCKIRFRSALKVALIMNIKGIIEIIHYYRWKANQYIDEQTYTQLVLSALAMTMTVTPLINFLSTSQTRLDLSRKHRGLRTLQSMPRNTEFRILFCVHNEESVHSIISLLEASNPTEASSICAYIVQTSELVGLAAPLLVPYDKRRRKLELTFSAGTEQIMRAFENYSRNSRGPVMVQPFIMIASYKTMHETVCRLAQDKYISLIIVPFHKNSRYIVGSGNDAILRQFNINVQAYAPCTIGILVDKGFSCGMSVASARFCYHVALIFIGGPDDREALAYADRMADHQSEVMVKVVRLVMRRLRKTESKFSCGNASSASTSTSSNYFDEDQEREEAALDESAVDDFKMKNIGSASVAWEEVEVDDTADVMNTIRSTKGHFDLVMVGRRRSWAAAAAEDEMSDFVENEELGVIGDMLASSDFCGGTVSVLVIQHYREGVTAIRTTSLKSKYNNLKYFR